MGWSRSLNRSKFRPAPNEKCPPGKPMTFACAEHRGSVRTASKSEKKPATTSSDENESRRWREGASTRRDAEICRQDKNDEAGDGPKLLHVGGHLDAAHFIQLPVGRDQRRGVDGLRRRDPGSYSLSRRHKGRRGRS